MTSKQILGFWVTFICFCTVSSMIVYPLGAFDFAMSETVVVLACAYAICGVFMYGYVRKNRAVLGKWFQ